MPIGESGEACHLRATLFEQDWLLPLARVNKRIRLPRIRPATHDGRSGTASLFPRTGLCGVVYSDMVAEGKEERCRVAPMTNFKHSTRQASGSTGRRSEPRCVVTE